jgi:hypothetical protein
MPVLLILESRTGVLSLVGSPSEAEARWEAIDIENAEFEFCDSAGQRFVGDIVSPVTAFDAGKFRLLPHGAADRSFAASVVSRSRVLSRPFREIRSLDDVRRELSAGETPGSDPGRP